MPFPFSFSFLFQQMIDVLLQPLLLHVLMQLSNLLKNELNVVLRHETWSSTLMSFSST